MEEEAFYLKLISNDERSFQLHPSNTVAHFTTELDNPIELDTRGGKRWQVAMTKINYPVSFFNVVDKLYYVKYYRKMSYLGSNTPSSEYILTYELPPGNYTNINTLLNYINSIDDIKGSFEVKFNEMTGCVYVEKADIPVSFSRHLSYMLGFSGTYMLGPGIPALYPINMYGSAPQQLLLYSDLITPQRVGSKLTGVLADVCIKDPRNFGRMDVYEPLHLEYKPILRNHISSIEMHLKSLSNETAPFQFGTSSVTVHFKPVSSIRDNNNG